MMAASAHKPLSAQALQDFHDNGWLAPVPSLSSRELGHYQRKFAEWEARYGGPIGGDDRNKSHLFLRWLDELVHSPAVLDVVEQILGPNIWLWHAQWFVKEAHSPHFISYHQDAAYWEIEPAFALSAWIAFEDSDEQNGCMRVIPGTHTTVLPHDDRPGAKNLLWRGQTARLEGHHEKSVPLVLKAGEMSLHDARIAHGSGPNRSARRRIGYSIRYVPTHVQRVGPRDSAMLVRGQDEYNQFDPEPRPVSDFEPEAVAFHARTTERFMSQYTTATVEANRLSAKP